MLKKDRDLYQQKMKAQLDEWRADVAKLKAKALGASADTQLELNRHVRNLEAKLEEGKAKLAELSSAGEDAWASVKSRAEPAWDSLKSAVRDAAAKFKAKD